MGSLRRDKTRLEPKWHRRSLSNIHAITPRAKPMDICLLCLLQRGGGAPPPLTPQRTLFGTPWALELAGQAGRLPASPLWCGVLAPSSHLGGRTGWRRPVIGWHKLAQGITNGLWCMGDPFPTLWGPHSPRWGSALSRTKRKGQGGMQKRLARGTRLVCDTRLQAGA